MSFLSIDVGSSRSKAAVLSKTGEVLTVRSALYAPSFTQPGFAELDPELFLASVTTLSREVTNACAKDPVEAVCFSSHGETIIPCSATGQALRPAILNIDTRAEREAQWLESTLGRERLFALTGHTSHTMYPAPKLLWLRKNAPQIFQSAARFCGVTDFLLLRLGLPPTIDYSHASRFLAFDIRRRIWSEEVLDAVQISPEKLSLPVQAGTIAGRLNETAAASLGVAIGTPVVVGGHDQVVGALGMGVIDARRAGGSLGSYDCVLAVSDEPQLNQAALRANLNSYPHVVAGKYVTIAYFPAGILTQWLVRLIEEDDGDEAAQFAALEAAAPTGTTGILMTPHLIGSCNPEFDAQAHAAIVGLAISSTRAHLYKGALEGIASEFALIAECMEQAGLVFQNINVSGGGTRSPLGLRLRAAMAGKALHTMRCEEAVCLGGAILASVAIGTHRSPEAAIERMVREKECVRADHELRESYAAQFIKYRRLRETMVHSANPAAGSCEEEIQPTGDGK